jgi:DHA2 family methylenomycin A resistance protein-like MFS transporter
MASAVVNALRQVGQVFGVAVLGALIYSDLPAASGTAPQLTPAQRGAFVTGLHNALWVCGLVLLAAAVPVAALSTTSRKPTPNKERSS